MILPPLVFPDLSIAPMTTYRFDKFCQLKYDLSVSLKAMYIGNLVVKPLATVAVILLTLATLGNVTPIGSFIFVLH